MGHAAAKQGLGRIDLVQVHGVAVLRHLGEGAHALVGDQEGAFGAAADGEGVLVHQGSYQHRPGMEKAADVP